MKKVLAIVIAAILLLSLVPAVALAGTGNDAPPGAHYNLNIIGLPKGVGYDKELNDNFDGGNGARIFVSRKGATQFYVKGIDGPYKVLDHDGTDGSVGTGFGSGPPAEWGIQFPYVDGKYQVDIYVRLVGPKTSECDWTATSDALDPIGSFHLDRNNKKFQLRTSDLLDDEYENILWTLDGKTKFRICQLRIYLTPR